MSFLETSVLANKKNEWGVFHVKHRNLKGFRRTVAQAFDLFMASP